MASMEYDAEPRPYEDTRDRDYARDRSASPGRRGSPSRDNGRMRSASPGGRGSDRSGPAMTSKEEAESRNTGNNLFVTGIHPRLTEQDVTRMFEEFGEVEKCQIMADPHSKESRGFGFVKMVTTEGADAARENLQGKVTEGRTLSIEKARRNRPRTPTPGKYFGPPKKEDFRERRGGFGGRFNDRGGRRDYDDRRGGYDRGYDRDRRDDRDRGGRYGDRYYSERHREDRDDYGGGSRGIDRYASRGEDGYSSRGGGGGGREDRRATGYEREAPAAPASAAPSAGASGYEARRGGEERYGSYGRDDERYRR